MSIVVKFTYKGEENMKKLLNKKGFTLIELIVVIAIIAILAAILIPALLNYIDAANEAKNTSNARSHYTAAMLWGATNDGDMTDFAVTGEDCDITGADYPLGIVIVCGVDDLAVTADATGVTQP
jgi:prepilin-type N-terminal cleavage/methylation domain-containing protein